MSKFGHTSSMSIVIIGDSKTNMHNQRSSSTNENNSTSGMKQPFKPGT